MDQILGLLEDYFHSTPQETIKKDLAKASELGFNGFSFEEYISNLHNTTSINLIDIGICDDIAYSDFYNTLVQEVRMDKEVKSICSQKILPLKNDELCYQESYGHSEMTFASAA